MAGYVQSTKGSTSSGSTCDTANFATQPTAGNLIVAGVSVPGAFGDITSVTDSAGNTYTSIINAAGQPVKLWKAFNIATTTPFKVTAHLNTTEEIEVIAQEFSGATTTNPEDKSSGNSGNSTALNSTSTSTLAQADEIVVGFGATAGGTLSAGSGYSNLDTVSSTATAGMESKVVSATSAVSATMTGGSSNPWGMLVATFKIANSVNATVSESVTVSENVQVALVSFANVSDSITVSENANPKPSVILFDAASSSAYQASLASYSWNHTTSGSARGLLVNVAIFATGSVSALTYNGVAMTFVRADAVGVYRNEVWRLENPASGTHAIAVTLSIALTSIGSAVSYNNVDQVNMVEAQSGATGTGVSTPSASVTPVSDQSFVVSSISTSKTSINPTAPAASRADNSGALGTGGISDLGPVTPAASTTMSWGAVGSLDSWALSVVALDPNVDTDAQISDSIAVSENRSVVLVSLVTASNSITVSENLSVTVPNTGPVNVSDSISVSEAIALNPTDYPMEMDSISVAENVQVNLLGLINVSDSITVTELINEGESDNITVSSNVTVSENLSLLVTTGFQPDDYVNFAFSTIAVVPSPASSGTMLTVQSGDGLKFPIPRFNAVVWPVGSYYGPEAQALTTNAEIVRVVAIAGDNFVIQRTQEGTTARSIQVGDAIEARVTAKTIDDIWDALGY